MRRLCALIVVAVVACGDTHQRRAPVGSSCEADSECVLGLCGGNVCLDPARDDDLDGLTNAVEVGLGSNPQAADTDGDGVDDRDELSEDLGVRDSDGDGKIDVVESNVADADGDCIVDELDARDDVVNDDPSPMVKLVCRRHGVCESGLLAVRCSGGVATCDYTRIARYADPEVDCDGVDENCDGIADESFPDSDGDKVADCVDPDAPTVRVSIAPLVPTTDDWLVAHTTPDHDINGDSIRYAYRWRRDDIETELTGERVEPALTQRGERWQVRVAAPQGPLATAEVVIANTPPSCANAVMLPSRGTTETTFDCRCQDRDDPDTDPPVDHCVFRSGERVIASTAANDGVCELDPALTTRGDVIVCDYFASDGTDHVVVSSDAVSIDNARPPPVESVTITPTSGSVDTTFTCAATASVVTDADGDPLRMHYTWLVAGYENPGVTSAQARGGDLRRSASEPIERARRGDAVWCRVRFFDGRDSSVPVDSPHVVLDNSPPAGGNVFVHPDSAHEGDTLTCLASGANDPDGDAILWSYSWIVDGTMLDIKTATLTGAHFDKGDSARCVATPSDGNSSGSVVASKNEIVIADSPPAIVRATLSPSEVARSGELVCAFEGWSDPDPMDSAATVRYAWFSGAPGELIAGQSSPTYHPITQARGTSIFCRVTPISDGVAGPAHDSNAATIVNRAPSIGGVALSPETADVDTTLVCSATTATDTDGDTIEYRYAWLKGGQPILGADASTLHGEFVKGDQLRCGITPDDGLDTGATVWSNAVVIGNRAPTLDDVELTPTAGTYCATFACTPRARDADTGDTLLFSYRWTKNDVAIANTTATFLAAGRLAPNDVLQCFARASDGTEQSSELASNKVAVRNTAPTIAAVEISPAQAKVGDMLTCSAIGFSDPECSPTPSYQYQWFDGAEAISGAQLPTLSTSSLSAGAVVACRVTPADGFVAGSPRLSPTVTLAASCSHSCENGGQCVGLDACLCPSGWTGPTCATPTCSPNCANGGSCSSPDRCTCPPGWTGATCTAPTCTPSCANGGSCRSPNSCDCANGWSGTSCAVPTCAPLCQNGSTCIAPDTCECEAGWGGATCATPTCSPPCANGGVCVEPDTCDCGETGFVGARCDESPIRFPLAGASVDVASIPGDENCWYAPMRRGTMSVGSTSWIVTAEHNACTDTTDRVIAYRSSDLATWSGDVVNSHSYPAGQWSVTVGVPDFISATSDHSGLIHLVYRLCKTAYCGSAIQYAFLDGAGWATRADVFDSVAIEQSQGNGAGASYASLSGTLMHDALNDRLSFFGTDFAWFKSSYNTVVTTAVPTSTFAGPAIQTTITGVTDHSPIASVDQDIDGTEAVQVWPNKSLCAIEARTRQPNSEWSPTVTIPLDYGPCSNDGMNDWNLVAKPSTVIGANGPEIIVQVHDNGIAGVADSQANYGLYWIRDIDTEPSVSWFPTAKSIEGRAFVARDGRIAYLTYANDDRAIAVWYPESDTRVSLLTTSRDVVQVDVDRRDPRFLAWVEFDGFGHYLRAAPLSWVDPWSCDPPCQNGGACTGPDVCACPANWSGPACSAPLCDEPVALAEHFSGLELDDMQFQSEFDQIAQPGHDNTASWYDIEEGALHHVCATTHHSLWLVHEPPSCRSGVSEETTLRFSFKIDSSTLSGGGATCVEYPVQAILYGELEDGTRVEVQLRFNSSMNACATGWSTPWYNENGRLESDYTELDLASNSWHTRTFRLRDIYPDLARVTRLVLDSNGWQRDVWFDDICLGDDCARASQWTKVTEPQLIEDIGDGSVSIAWTALDGADFYRVDRYYNGQLSSTVDTTETGFIANKSQTSWLIRALDASGTTLHGVWVHAESEWNWWADILWASGTFSDDFEDGVVDAPYLNLKPYQVVETGGYLQLTQTATDDYSNFYLPYDTQGRRYLRFSARIFQHRANDNWLGGIQFWARENMYKHFQFGSHHHSYRGHLGGVIINGNRRAPSHTTPDEVVILDSVERFDRWFDYELLVDTQTGEISGSLDSESFDDLLPHDVSFQANGKIIILFSPYGWYTGHFLRVDDLFVDSFD